MWDRLTAQRHVTATAGNDSHANVGLIATAEGERLILENPLGKVIGGFNQKDVPPFLLGVPAYKQGEKVVDVRFDPYEVSLGYVSTHLLAKAVTEKALFDALLHGRAYIAFDWIADPSGFSFTGDGGGKHGTMGDDLPVGTRLSVRTDLAGTIRLLRGGVEVGKAEGRELTATADRPGLPGGGICSRRRPGSPVDILEPDLHEGRKEGGPPACARPGPSTLNLQPATPPNPETSYAASATIAPRQSHWAWERSGLWGPWSRRNSRPTRVAA